MDASVADDGSRPPDAAAPGASAPALGTARVAFACAALAVVLTLFVAQPFPWPTNRFDTGIPLVAADRILAGERPYVDFQTLYTPGYYHLVALAFRLFGRSFDVYHAVETGVGIANTITAFVVAWRLGRTLPRAAVAVVAGLASLYAYAALTPALVALLVASGGPRSTTRRLLLAGALAGLAAWCRQDVGAAAAVAVGVTAWVRGRLEHPSGGALSVPALRALVLSGAVAALTLAVLLSPALLSAPSRLLDGLVLNPAATVSFRQGDRTLVEGLREFPAAGPVFAACVLLTLAAAAAALAPRRFARLLDPRVPVPLFAGLAVFGAWAVRYFVLRPDTHHILPATLLVGTLGAVRWRGSERWLGPGRLSVVLVLGCLAVPAGQSVLARTRQILGRRATDAVALGSPVRGATRLYLPGGEVAAYRDLLAHLAATTAPGEPIFSACTRHDLIHDQDLVLYFAAERPAAVFDHHFDPGVTTRDDVQGGIIDDLERANVRTVVRFRSRLPAESAQWPPGSTRLDEWLAAHFEAGPRYGRYEVWRRR